MYITEVLLFLYIISVEKASLKYFTSFWKRNKSNLELSQSVISVEIELGAEQDEMDWAHVEAVVEHTGSWRSEPSRIFCEIVEFFVVAYSHVVWHSTGYGLNHVHEHVAL